MSSDDSHQPREEISDRLIELYFQHDEACRNRDWPYADALQREINKTHRERRESAPAQNAMRRPLDKQARRAMREKAVVRQVAKKVRLADQGGRQVETTETGLPVEGQVRKQWNPEKGGLPTFLRA